MRVKNLDHNMTTVTTVLCLAGYSSDLGWGWAFGVALFTTAVQLVSLDNLAFEESFLDYSVSHLFLCNWILVVVAITGKLIVVALMRWSKTDFEENVMSRESIYARSPRTYSASRSSLLLTRHAKSCL